MLIREILFNPKIVQHDAHNVVKDTYHSVIAQSSHWDEFTSLIHLPGFYQAFRSSNQVIVFYFADMDKTDPLLAVFLKRFQDGWSSAVASHSQIRGQGLAYKTYIVLSDYLKEPIYSDAAQSTDSRHAVWAQLIKHYPERVVAYDQVQHKDVPIQGNAQHPVIYDKQPIYVHKPYALNRMVVDPKRQRTRLLKLLP